MGFTNMSEILPDNEFNQIHNSKNLIITCGAIAKEILQIIKINNIESTFDLQCIPAILHNHPEKIAPLLKQKIEENKPNYDKIIVGFGDCGSGGKIQNVCKTHGVEYIDSPHCYAFLYSNEKFDKLASKNLGTFYLTDYLARHFNSLIKVGMLRNNDKLKQMFFQNYTDLVYLSQTDDKKIEQHAIDAAEYLGLKYSRVHTGYGELQNFIIKNS